MDNKTVFVVTLKGEGEIKNHTRQLPEDIKRALMLVDDESSVEILARRAAPSVRAELSNMLQKLEKGGFIQDKANARTGSMLKMATPKISVPPQSVEEKKSEVSEDLDFTGSVSSVTPMAEKTAQAEAARMKADAEARAREEAAAREQQAEAARLKALQEAAQVRASAEAVRIKAEQDAAKARADLEAARLEAGRARAELEAAKVKAEALAKREAEAARLREEEAAARAQAEAKAKANLEAARIKTESEAKAKQEAAKARAELEAARLEAEQARAELEAAKVKAEALAKREAEASRLREEEAAAKAQAEAKAREEQEAARRKTEAEAARRKAEEVVAKAEAEAAKVKAELEAAQAKAESEAQARAEAEARANQEASRIKIEAEAKAKQETEAARRKAEEEVAQAKAEAEAARRKAEEEVAQARAEAEAARLKAEQEAARVKAELETAQAKADAEAQAHAGAEARAKQEAEAKANQEAEATRLKAEQEIARIKAEAENQIRQATQAKIDAESALAAKTKADAAAARSMIATVLFFDVVGYTKQSVSKQIELKGQFNQLVSAFIKDIAENQRIILDTGDGAAIGFLQHPEDAIEVALKFRNTVTANRHLDYPDLKVRIGIHLGPVNIVKDMNGQSNMVGDGINDAQRIMSFASSDHIYISRSYYDVVSRLDAKYAKLFQYRGVKNDKHGRQHQVYEANVEETEGIERTEDAGQSGKQKESASFSIKLEPFALDGLETTASTQLPAKHAPSLDGATQETDKESNLPPSEFHVSIEAEAIPAQTMQAAVVGEPAPSLPQENSARGILQEIKPEVHALIEEKAQQKIESARILAEQEAAREKAEKEARQMAEEQARVWAEAEQRARKQEAMSAKVDTQQPKTTVAHPARPIRRKPLPLGKLASGLFVLLLALVVALPYVWPMQDYIQQLEKKLSAQLQQPVHIGHMKATLLPPKLELREVFVGGAQELKAANAVLNFDVTALFSSVRSINNVEITDLALNTDSFGQALSWLQAAGGDTHYPIARMVLKHTRISGEGISLPPVNGSADWDAQGHFSKAVLRSEDDKLNVELQAHQSHWQIALHVKESRLPGLSGILFNELNVKGEADEGAADLTEIDGSLYGGKLAGSARLNWQKGWQMQGRLNIKAMELKQAFSQFGLEGEMEGDSRFQLNGATLAQLAYAPHLDGTFIVKKGMIGKIDLVETAANRRGVAGGRTHFDELSGTLQLENNAQHFRQLKISSGGMNATGSADIGSGGQMSGRLLVDLKMRAGSAALALSGSLTSPILHPAH